MKEINLPISLYQLLVTNTESGFRPTPQQLRKLAFDERKDLAVSEDSPNLAIRMDFINERVIEFPESKGGRHTAKVILFDCVTHKAIREATSKVTFKKGENRTSVYSILPLDYESVDFDHPYKVAVMDEKTGEILGKKEIRLFKLFYGNISCDDLIKPMYGGVQPYNSTELYKGFRSEDTAYHYVKFYLLPNETNEGPTALPEMEVRIYFPDGSIDRKFARPERVNEGEGYFVISAPFLHTPLRGGICYAELICLDFLTCGFVFSTVEKEPIKGRWSGHGLSYLDWYTPGNAAMRYRQTLLMGEEDISDEIESERNRDYEESGEPEEADEFERLLEEFISSDKDDAGEGLEEEKENNNEESETEEADKGNEAVTLSESSPLSSLDTLTGLTEVKEKIRNYEKFVLFNKKREGAGLKVIKQPLHAMFCGAPGTGKTTVAKRMGVMLRRAGVLSRGHVVVRERSTLLGAYYSSEQTNTLAALEEAQGGILFIDEAYQLYQPDDPRDPGRLVIEALLSALADDSQRDWMLILAGYTEEMRMMFELNPGFKSRIPESNIYLFPDYSEEELMEIAESYLERHGYALSPDARHKLCLRLGEDYARRDKTFGNARHVINLIQTEILPAMASRVIENGSFDSESLSLIQACDIHRGQSKLSTKRTKVGFRA